MTATELRENTRLWIKKNQARKNAVDEELRLRKTYGITVAEREAMRERQDNRCAICKETFLRLDFEARQGKPNSIPHVDHCHTSNVVRDLLCFKCNTGLGQFDDRPDLLARAIAYLQRHNVEAESE